MQKLPREELPPGHEGGGHPPRAHPLPRGPMVALLHLFQHKPEKPTQARVPATFAAIFDLLAQSTSHKTAWGVPWYVTPPLVQLVFVLVLYTLQICAA